MPEPAGAAQSPSTPDSGVGPQENGHRPPESVLGRLREQYATAGEERRETFPILPGRFNDSLAMEARPVDFGVLRKRMARMAKRGRLRSEEGQLDWAAAFVVDACEQILVRTEDDGDWAPLHEAAPSLGATPVRFDSRLCSALGIDTAGRELSGADVVRLLFRNPAALNDFYVALDLWNKEVLPEDEDEEDEGARPTR